PRRSGAGVRGVARAAAESRAQPVRARPRVGAGRRSRAREDALPGIPGADAAGRRRARRARDRPGCAVRPLVRPPDHGSRGRVSCPMPTPFRYLAVLTLCLVPAVATGQGTAVAPPLAWWPRSPLQGSLVRLVVRPPPGDSVTAVYGELAGEPLHFERFADGLGGVGAGRFSGQGGDEERGVVGQADSRSHTG